MIEPVEYFFGGVGDRFLGLFDNFDSLERGVLRLVFGLLWPLRMIGRGIGKLLPGSQSGTGLFSLPGRAMHRVVEGVIGLAEKLNLDGALFLLVRLLTPVWWPVATLLGFLHAWLVTRRVRELALSVPAVLMAAPFAYVAWAGATQSDGQIATRYKEAVRDALEVGEAERAQLFERKLAQLGVDTRRTDFRNASAIAADGDMATAYARMKRLAPADQLGYAPAHAWIVQRLLTEELTAEEEPALAESSEGGESQRLALAEQHLERLDEHGSTGPGIAQLRAFVRAATGAYAEAAAELEAYVSQSSDLAAMRMRYLVAAKQLPPARAQAEQLLQLYAREAPTESSDREPDYAAWALAAELTGDDRQLEQALDRWRGEDLSNPRMTKLLAALRRRQVEKLLVTRTANPESLVDRLVQAAELGSSRRWINRQVTRIAAGDQASHTGKLAWERLASAEEAPESLREIVATTAASRGDIRTAQQLFRRLIAEGSDDSSAWNNYAWTLAQPPEPDYEAALEAVNRALQSEPQDYRYRETRGQVLIKLSRWQEAIADLEYALNGMPGSADIHRSLAEAYEATSQTDLARIHREQL